MLSPIVLLFLINALSSIGYSLIAPLFPYMASDRGISATTIGFIFSSYAISNVIAIPLTPFIVSKFGRRRLFYISMIMEASCTLTFGITNFISSKGLFLTVSIIARLFQGIGSAFSSTLVYSTAATISDESNIKLNLGYVELGYSIGLAIGPLLASLFFYLLGYSCPFFVCGTMALFCLLFISHLPIEEDEKQEDMQFFKILFDLEILLTFLAVIIDMTTTTFVYPVFATHLHNKFQLGVEGTSVFFAIELITYFITLQFLIPVSTVFGLKHTMACGLFINTLVVPLLAPVSFLPQTLITIIIGLVLLGMSGALITIPALVDLISTMKNKLKIDELSAHDHSSALYGLACNLGEAIGPIFGGYFTEQGGFESACYMNSLTNCIFGIIFVSYNLNTLKKEYLETKSLTEKEEIAKFQSGHSSKTIGLGSSYSRHSKSLEYSLIEELSRL